VFVSISERTEIANLGANMWMTFVCYMHILWYRNPLLEQYLGQAPPYAVVISSYF